MALHATYIGVGRRNRSFLCMCSRNCIFIIIISNIIFVLVVMYQNRQVMVTSFPRVTIVGVPAKSGRR